MSITQVMPAAFAEFIHLFINLNFKGLKEFVVLKAGYIVLVLKLFIISYFYWHCFVFEKLEKWIQLSHLNFNHTIKMIKIVIIVVVNQHFKSQENIYA